MRFRKLPEGLLASAGRVAVITALLRRPNKVWTGSELARAAEVTPRWAISTLRLLEAEGVVHPEWSPPSMLWTVNKEHLLVKMLSSIAAMDAQAQRALRTEVGRAVAPVRPLKAVLFGSMARGQGAPDSDVDVLVVVKDVRAKTRAQAHLARAADPFFWRFGNRLAPIVLTRREFEVRRSHGFVQAALEHGTWIQGGPRDG